MTTVELFKDIGLYMSMKKTIDFTSKATQNTWFSSKVSKTVSNVAFNKLQNLLHIPMDYGEALEYTYVRFKSLDSSGRVYYYFIHSATLIDDTTVAFQLVLDPIQTFMCEWEIGECMVNRKHCDRWNKTSSLPIRNNPNIEGLTTNYLTSKVTKMSDVIAGTNWNVASVVISMTKDNNLYTLGAIVIVPTEDTPYPPAVTYVTGTKSYRMPTLLQIFSNKAFVDMGVDIEAIYNCAIVPFNVFNGSFKDVSTSEVTFNGWFDENFAAIGSTTYMVRLKHDGMALNPLFTLNEFEPFTRPSKPSNGNIYSSMFEPNLYKEPYIIRKVVTGSGSIDYTIPDIIVNETTRSVIIEPVIGTSTQLFNIYIGTQPDILDPVISKTEYINDKSEGKTSWQMIDSTDVFTNAWLTYTLTQRDSDHNILNNTLKQEAISNMIFMGYGGALVGSRGGGEGYAQGLGKATLPAVALASAASLVNSAINSHYAWKNQAEQERKIQNQAQQINIAGTNGIVNLINEYSYINVIEQTCDDVSYSIAAKNFRYYGYEINEWQKPNIKSRKYFDYILTNGAVIDGALNQNIKEQIANIFDNGITIFHGDYTDSLEYPTYENIERSLL